MDGAFQNLSEKVQSMTTRNTILEEEVKVLNKENAEVKNQLSTVFEKIRIMEETWGQSISGIEKGIEYHSKQKKVT